MAPRPTQQIGPVTVYFGEKNGKYPDGNQVVVRGKDTTLAFDTPLSANELLPELQAVDGVVLSHVHEDHTCALHALPHVPVQAHEVDLPALQSWEGLYRHFGYSPAAEQAMAPKLRDTFRFTPRPDATAYADGAVWDLGGVRVRAIHLPGHTGGHCVLLVEPEGIAFLGDIELSSFGPYYGDACSSLADFRRTLARLPALEATAWITSHHKGAITDRATFDELLGRFTARLDERGQAIEAALAERPRTLGELVAQRFVFPPGHEAPAVDDIERHTIRAHLAELQTLGRVTEADGAYRTVAA